MSIIQLQTNISAPIGICFDLSRSIELHILSTAHTKETVIAGKMSGLCNTGDTITWRARHFGIYQRLTVMISDLRYPDYFEDKMVKGAFQSFTHKHNFKPGKATTLMEDHFEYFTPYGLAGKLFNKIVLYKYMEQLLVTRNNTIKQMAESGEWKKVLMLR